MTDTKLGKVYEAARNAARAAGDPLTMPAVRAKARHQAAQCVDVMAMSIDERQAKMLDWAEANGYPEWGIVLNYGAGTWK